MDCTISFPGGNVTFEEPVLMDLVADAAMNSFGVCDVKDILFIDNKKNIPNFCDLELHVTLIAGIDLRSNCDVLMENVKYRLEGSVGLCIDRFDLYIDAVVHTDEAGISKTQEDKSIDEMLRDLETTFNAEVDRHREGLSGEQENDGHTDMGELI